MAASNATSAITTTDSSDAFALYRYTPSLASAVLFAGCFLVAFAAHFIHLLRLKTLYFTPFTIGGLLEALGYMGRAWSHYDKLALAPYIMQSLLILIAPALFAATIYMILGRIMRHVNGEHHSLIPIKWLTKAFVLGDCLSFTIQAGGGGIQSAGTLELLHLGEKIIIVGLFIQLAIFGFFMVSAVVFHVRILSSPTSISLMTTVPWKRHLFILYVTSILIMVRSVFRVIEYLQGNSGYILQHEYLLYLFDAALMVAVMVVFYIRYPGDLRMEERKYYDNLDEFPLRTVSFRPIIR